MKTIALTSGKGGVGKTFLAVNLAVSMAQKGKRVVLFDADLQLANVDVMLDVRPLANLQHVVAGEATLTQILTPGPAGIQLITGGSALPGLMNAGPKRMATFLSQIDDLESWADVLIFDTGAGLDQRVMTFLRLAEEVVLVCTPEPTSVTDAYALAKTYLKKDPEAQISVLVNDVQSQAEGPRVFQTLNGIAERFLERPLSYLGAVAMDLRATESIRRRHPLMLMDPYGAAATDIRSIADRLLLARPLLGFRRSA